MISLAIFYSSRILLASEDDFQSRRGFERGHGTVGEDGVLRGTLGNGAEVAYTLSQDQQTLSGEYVLSGRTTRGRFTRQ